MKLYTLISIALSVFGGTYAAMNALRNRFDSFIQYTQEKGRVHLKKLTDFFDKDSTTVLRGENHLRGLNRAAKSWRFFNTIPIMVFATLIFLLAIWILVQWDYLCKQAGDLDVSQCTCATYIHYGFLLLIVVDVGCFIGAGIAWVECGYHGRGLHDLFISVVDREKRTITPAEAVVVAVVPGKEGGQPPA